MTTRHSERNAEIRRRRRDEGHTLEEIAADYGLTRERVRQITADIDSPEVRERVRAHLSTTREAARTERVSARVVAAEQAVRDGSDDAHALVLAVPVAERSTLLHDYMTAHMSAARSVTQRRYTDEELLDALRTVAREVGTEPLLSAWAYDKHRTDGMPSTPTFGLRFESWTEACARAGLRAHQPRSGGYQRRFSDDDLIAAVAAYVAETGRTSHYGYEVWSKGRDERPSGSLIRQRLRRPWHTIIATAREIEVTS